MSGKDHLLDADYTGPAAGTDGKNARQLGSLLLLICGDALAFLIFSATGRRSHGEAVGLDAIGQVFVTALPFALAWFVVSPLVGAYRRRLRAAPRQMAQQTALAWLAAWPLAMLLRVLITQRVPEWTFFLISLAANLLFLEIWRVAFALVSSKRR